VSNQGSGVGQVKPNYSKSCGLASFNSLTFDFSYFEHFQLIFTALILI